MGYSCNACGRWVEGGGSCGCYQPAHSNEYYLQAEIAMLKAERDAMALKARQYQQELEELKAQVAYYASLLGR